MIMATVTSPQIDFIDFMASHEEPASTGAPLVDIGEENIVVGI